ncbi:MAG: uroporphyrinogen decarboxylase family protein [Nitrospinae bacterium]|nr:uroporphyrinogen decarboxylase family protein [Nitrospinota bacterium]
MAQPQLTSMQRVLTTLSHKEPDRVPLFLLLTMHGAKELGISIKEYFSKAEYVVEGQLRMLKKYRHDCLYNFYYAPLEVEAWGADVIFREDCPPNSGAPFIRKADQIKSLRPPSVKGSRVLQKTLESGRSLKAAVGDTVPIIGVVMSPFSLPVMQMGFDKYLELIFEEPALFERLMEVNEAFCIEWANAQLASGVTAIVYFDPVSSSSIIPRETFMRTGFNVARRVIPRIKGPVAMHFASERCLPMADVLPDTGALAVGVSSMECLAALKKAYGGKMALVGNLNGIEMRTWNAAAATNAVRDAIAKGGAGGGFILSDNHGEIPWQVPEQTLLAISEAAHTLGRYPLAIADNNAA